MSVATWAMYCKRYNADATSLCLAHVECDTLLGQKLGKTSNYMTSGERAANNYLMSTTAAEDQVPSMIILKGNGCPT